ELVFGRIVAASAHPTNRPGFRLCWLITNACDRNPRQCEPPGRPGVVVPFRRELALKLPPADTQTEFGPTASARFQMARGSAFAHLELELIGCTPRVERRARNTAWQPRGRRAAIGLAVQGQEVAVELADNREAAYVQLFERGLGMRREILTLPLVAALKL